MASTCQRLIITSALCCASFLSVNSLWACTGFVVAEGDTVLAGNNEDYWDVHTLMWFEPAEKGKYGRVYFGFANGFPQGGMNTEGLFFDGFATAPRKVKGSSGKPKFQGTLIDEAMATCRTVQEVIDLFQKYDLEFLEKAMLFFADKSGDAVIIEGDAFVRKEGSFQIVTNFYQSRVTSPKKPCARFNIAHEMLSVAKEYSVDLCRRVLAATHAEGKSTTLYSNIYDLEKGIVFLYHFHNFENVVTIDLARELQKGKHVVRIASLFPRTFAAEQFKRVRESEYAEIIEKRALPGGLKASTLDQYVGHYKFSIAEAPDLTLEVTRDGTKLHGLITGRDKVELHPESQTSFFCIVSNKITTFEFHTDDDGKATRVVCQGDSGEYIATRLE